MSDWRPIDDPPELPEGERSLDVIVTDGQQWTRAVYIGDRFAWVTTHLVAKSDATHYLIPDLP